MDTPTIADVRIESPLLAERLPSDNDGPDDEALTRRVRVASVMVGSMTFRLIDPVEASSIAGCAFEEVPVGLEPLAVRAVALFTERSVVQGLAANAEAAATGRRLRSISAGPWSESYFAPGEYGKAAGSTRPMMDPDPEIDALLWALATQCAREYFVANASGVVQPGASAANLPWNRAMRGY